MSSKLITDREKSAEAVIAAGETNAGTIHQALSALCKPYLEQGEVMPDFGLVARLLVRFLSDQKGQMVQADHKHEIELGDDPEKREARDGVATKLYDTIIEDREMLVGLFGPKVAGKIIVGGTPRDPVVLSRFAREVIDNLSSVTLPAPRFPGVTFDVNVVASALSALKDELDARIRDVAREVREAQVTQVEKDRSIASYDDAFSKVAGAISTLLRLAGNEELAARVRPSTRRPGRIEEPNEGGEGPPPTP